MPIYEYDCPKCGIIEVSRKISDSTLKKCPDCKSGITKLISLSSFSLKGTGWYTTDYGKGNGGNAKNKEQNKKEKKEKETKEVKETKPKETTASTTDTAKSAATG